MHAIFSFSLNVMSDLLVPFSVSLILLLTNARYFHCVGDKIVRCTRHLSRAQGPRTFGQRVSVRRVWNNGPNFPRKLAVPVVSHNYPKVSPGAHMLTKKP